MLISTTESESCLLVTLLLDTPGPASLLSRDTLDREAAPPPGCMVSHGDRGVLLVDTGLGGAWSGVSRHTLESIFDNLYHQVIFGSDQNNSQ